MNAALWSQSVGLNQMTLYSTSSHPVVDMITHLWCLQGQGRLRVCVHTCIPACKWSHLCERCIFTPMLEMAKESIIHTFLWGCVWASFGLSCVWPYILMPRVYVCVWVCCPYNALTAVCSSTGAISVCRLSSRNAFQLSAFQNNCHWFFLQVPSATLRFYMLVLCSQTWRLTPFRSILKMYREWMHESDMTTRKPAGSSHWTTAAHHFIWNNVIMHKRVKVLQKNMNTCLPRHHQILINKMKIIQLLIRITINRQITICILK